MNDNIYSPMTRVIITEEKHYGVEGVITNHRLGRDNVYYDVMIDIPFEVEGQVIKNSGVGGVYILEVKDEYIQPIGYRHGMKMCGKIE